MLIFLASLVEHGSATAEGSAPLVYDVNGEAQVSIDSYNGYVSAHIITPTITSISEKKGIPIRVALILDVGFVSSTEMTTSNHPYYVIYKALRSLKPYESYSDVTLSTTSNGFRVGKPGTYKATLVIYYKLNGTTSSIYYKAIKVPISVVKFDPKLVRKSSTKGLR